MARVTGCQASSFPITYLGLPIGKSMYFLSSWNTLIDKFISKLLKWKASFLSIEGRFTLIKSVLGILGLTRWHGFDGKMFLRLLIKEVKLIKAIHGYEAGFDGKGCASSGVWSSIVGSTNYLHSHNLLPKASLKCHLGNVSDIAKDPKFGSGLGLLPLVALNLCSNLSKLSLLKLPSLILQIHGNGTLGVTVPLR
ncbi:hypothetical protein Tco_1394957 [Tanacetum coccineum]